jgi:chromosome segregation ATPase
MDQPRERQQDVEAFRQQLADSQAECDRLREQTHALEVQVAGIAGLQARLEAAEASSRERDRWQAEALDLQAKLTADSAEREQLGRLAADLHAAQREQDRLQSEQQTSRHAAEQAQARVSELEQALAEAAATHKTALVAAFGDVQARLAAEREEWRQRLEAAQQQLVWERRLFQLQNEQNRQQAASLQTERDRLAARLAQAVWHLRTTQERSPDEASRAVELQHQRQQAARDQVFVQLSSIRLGNMLQQAARPQNSNAPASQTRPRALLARERAPVEEPRLTAVAQEVQVAWGETAVGQELLPALGNPLDRVGEEVSEVGFDADGEKAVEHQLAPAASPIVPADEGEASAPSDTPHGSAAALGGGQPAEDVDGCLPQQTDSRSEARQGVWRQIFGFVLGK